MSNSPIAICPKCKLPKELTSENFYRNSKLKSGFNVWCKGCLTIARHSWHVRNLTAIHEKNKVYYRANLERIEAHRINRIPISSEYFKARYARLKDDPLFVAKKRARKHRRRAREKGLPGKITGQQILSLYAEQFGCCFYCGSALNNNYDIEHKIPIARTELNPTNDITNIVLSCRACNLSKGCKTSEEFEQYRLRKGKNLN